MGYDLDGAVVYNLDFGKWDFRNWAQQSEENIERFLEYFEQGLRRFEKDAGTKNGTGVAEIIDFDGFSLSHHASQSAIKIAMRMFAGLQRLNLIVSYGFIVNVNFAAETFLRMARPFVCNFLDKFEIYGTRMDKWKPMMLKKISADQLPPKYGGSSDWKPVPFHS